MVERKKPSVPALIALARAAACFDLAIESSQLEHKLGLPVEKIDDIALCRCANWIGLRARKIRQPLSRLNTLPLPVLFLQKENCYLLLELSETHAVIYCALTDKEKIISREQLEQLWSGEVILLAKAKNSETKVAFGFGWFLPLILKHGRQLRNIVFISLLLQAILLVTPMLFETIIDKVLVSRGVDSLMVLGMAMIGLAVAEPVYTLCAKLAICKSFYPGRRRAKQQSLRSSHDFTPELFQQQANRTDYFQGS